MKICVLVLMFVAYVGADCGCLKNSQNCFDHASYYVQQAVQSRVQSELQKCSKHLVGYDIPGPTGCPIKVVFKKPAPCGCHQTNVYSGTVQAPLVIPTVPKLPGKSYNYKVEHFCKKCVPCVEDCGGQQYNVVLQAPPPSVPKIPLPLLNLKYRTDTVLVPPPNCGKPEPCAPVVPTLTPEIISWLQNLQNSQSCKPAVPSSPIFERLTCCDCDRLDGNSFLDYTNSYLSYFNPKCNCKRCKRDLSHIDDNNNNHQKWLKVNVGHPFEKENVEPETSRRKRDLAKHGYNFLMNMLPQSVRSPLHHSFQAITHLKEPASPKSDLKRRLEELQMKQANNFNNFKSSLFNHPQGQSQYLLPKNNQYSSLNQKERIIGHKMSPHYSVPKKQYSFINDEQEFSYIDEQKKAPKYSFLKQTEHKYGKGTPKSSLHPSQESSFPGLNSALAETSDPLLDSKYKRFLHTYNPHQPFNMPKLPARFGDAQTNEQASLLRKLKKLNNNPLTSDLENQATVFMQGLLGPDKAKQRSKRSAEDAKLSRKKRTIILGSDEIDLPPHYEIDMVSEEDEEFSSEEKHEPNNYFSSEDFDNDNPIVGSTFMRKLGPIRRFPSPMLQPKPDIILGKNVIQKAVKEELDAYHKKVQKEQKMKELLERKQKDPFKFGNSVPHNPIFLLLTAPMKFLKHFSDLNKGVNPVMTSLPKLVYTTKKYFRDFGKNFHKNCLNLASDIIGDFDHVQPNVIQKIIQPDVRSRHRREVNDKVLKCIEEENIDQGIGESNNDGEEIKKNKGEENYIIENGVVKSQGKSVKDTKLSFITENNSQNEDKSKITETEHSEDFLEKPGKKLDSDSLINEEKVTNQGNLKQYEPQYSLSFKASGETQNFREVTNDHVRKKRYVVKVVDDGDIQDHVENYLAQKLEDNDDYLKPLQDYYTKVNDFLTKLYTDHQPLCQHGDECFYYNTGPTEEKQGSKEDSYQSFEDSFETKPKKKKIRIKKLKPRVIIDNKGLPFMEYNGFKRPLILHGKKRGLLMKGNPKSSGSSEETGNKIAVLIARAKEQSEVVGAAQNNIVPQKIIKERISSLLEEIDQLVHLNAENYDEIFEDLIKIQHIKTSIEQDWKRLLIDNKVDDIRAKIGLLSKFKDLQQLKDTTIKNIAERLKNNDNEFVRKRLINSLIRLQKLQCLITNVVEDFEQHLKMKTLFNMKKEIKYVDYLSELKFVSAKTRNDLIKNLGRDRDHEAQKNIEILHKLKKLLNTSGEDSAKMDQAAKVIWEMKNLEKLQMETIETMNRKLSRNFKIKKELKILFDLQKRFEDCETELNGLLGNIQVKAGNKLAQKKDIKDIIADVKKKHEEFLQKALERTNSLQKPQRG